MSKNKYYDVPTLWVDVDDLHIPCAVPTVDVAERIMDSAKNIASYVGRLTEYECANAFTLLAEVLSCNHNYMEYQADELRKKRITVAHIIDILADWVVWIGELIESKN